jgi:hypothetical protein
VPWRRPGFQLGVDIAAIKAEHPESIGCVLGGHGITAWGDTSGEAEAARWRSSALRPSSWPNAGAPNRSARSCTSRCRQACGAGTARACPCCSPRRRPCRGGRSSTSATAGSCRRGTCPPGSRPCARRRGNRCRRPRRVHPVRAGQPRRGVPGGDRRRGPAFRQTRRSGAHRRRRRAQRAVVPPDRRGVRPAGRRGAGRGHRAGKRAGPGQGRGCVQRWPAGDAGPARQGHSACACTGRANVAPGRQGGSTWN